MRTMARQVYAFAVAKARGWDGPADELIAHGLAFMADKGRTERGGWVRTLNVDGCVADPVEDAYDHSCVLLALAHAHRVGTSRRAGAGARDLPLPRRPSRGRPPDRLPGDAGRPGAAALQPAYASARSVPRLAYGDRRARLSAPRGAHHRPVPQPFLRSGKLDARASISTTNGSRRPNGQGDWTEPGHHFEWASLLVDFAEKSGQKDLVAFARKLYASAIANGLNRATGLAYAAVSRQALPLDLASRSWPQAEAIKAAIALDRPDGPDLKPEIEARVGRLFRWHIDPAPRGPVDRPDRRARQGDRRPKCRPASSTTWSRR